MSPEDWPQDVEAVKRWLMDILACPAEDCKGELQIDVYESHMLDSGGEQVEEIDEALIVCSKCGRWYPVIDGIVCMLPDEMRLEQKQRHVETAFLEKWKDRIPEHVLDNGRPFGLSTPADDSTTEG